MSTNAENLAAGLDTAKDIVLELIIDDGISDRGHRTNIFDPSLHVMSSFTGPHTDMKTVSVIDYAGNFISKDAPDPLQTQIDSFATEKVNFTMPDNFSSWTQRTEVHSKGEMASKKVTRDVVLESGEKVELVESEDRQLKVI